VSGPISIDPADRGDSTAVIHEPRAQRQARRLPLLGNLAAAGLFLAACSPAATPSPPTAPPTAAPPSPTESAAPSAASPSTATGATLEITVATDARLGKFLAGKDGKTLYIFKKDTANASNCTAGCAQAWPPLTLATGEQVKAGAGITGTFTTFARADGSMQVAYKSAPLYYYASDAKAGDVTGQGVNNVWFVATP
jgi:predicted lipoprotein with Yx(FWY)xxD motif